LQGVGGINLFVRAGDHPICSGIAALRSLNLHSELVKNSRHYFCTVIMSYRALVILAAAALLTTHVASAQAQPAYVPAGGMYIGPRSLSE